MQTPRKASTDQNQVDVLVVDPEHDVDRITEALLEELLRSASNKGCTVVEAIRPDDTTVLDRWQRSGFSQASPRIEKIVTAASTMIEGLDFMPIACELARRRCGPGGAARRCAGTRAGSRGPTG